jgi:hypothetical protein
MALGPCRGFSNGVPAVLYKRALEKRILPSVLPLPLSSSELTEFHLLIDDFEG